MGKYSGMITAANNYTGNLSAIDFTEWDDTLFEFPNQSVNLEAEGAEVRRDVGKISNPTLTDDGVLLDGSQDQIFFRMTTSNRVLRSAVLIFKVSSLSTGTLFESGPGTSGSFNFRGYMYSTGNFEGDAGTGTGSTAISEANEIEVGKICHLMLVNNGANSKVYFGVDGVTQSLPIAESITVSGTSLFTSIGSTRNRFTFANMEVLFYAAWSSETSEAELLGLIQQFGKYGQMTFLTNLESTRVQSALALGPNREINSSAGVPVGTNELSINIPVKPGNLIEFFAFDSDENSTNLTTGPIIPNDQEPLVFNPVAGGGDTDPGTGLIARIVGTVDIEGTPAAREIIVISDDPNGRQVLGEGVSAEDGTFDIQYNDWGGAVIALALDNYGGDWKAETVLSAGTIIHPTAPNGYVYEATIGGTTGASEPTWGINGTVNDGSVTWNPRPFYRPIASGPIKGEVLQEAEILISQIRFDNVYGISDYWLAIRALDFLDENGNPIDATGATVTASASDTGSDPYFMIDGDIDTKWYSEPNTFPLSLEFVFATPVKITGMYIDFFGIGGGKAYAPSDMEVSMMDDGSGVYTLTDTFVGLTNEDYNLPDSQDGTFALTMPTGGAAEPTYSATFWRIYITRNSTDKGDVTAIVDDIEFYSDTDQLIDTTQGTAIASTFYGSGNLKQHAFDGDLTTGWASAQNDPLPQWIGYEFLESTTVGRVALKTGENTFHIDRSPITFDIQKSDDGTTWETVRSIIDAAPWSANEYREYFL